MKFVDFHCDTIACLVEDKNASELRKNNLCVDVEKLKKGNSLAQFFSLFMNLKNINNPFEYCMKMLNRFYVQIETNKKDIAVAKSYEDIMANEKEGKISALLTIEEGAALKGELSNLRTFHELGVRLITLTWNYPNEIGYPNCDERYRNKGLTAFGRELIEEMNKLHMLIDVSHLSDGGFYDVLKLSSKPFVASHSNARVITNHSRNLTDDMIKKLSNKGGIMGLNFCNEFLGEAPVSRIESMIEHIKHIRRVGGIDVIALGSDFDGISCSVEIKDVSEMYKLESALKKNGFSEADIEKIFYLNALRVIKEM